MSSVKWFGITCVHLQMMDYHVKQLFDDVTLLEPQQAMEHLTSIRDHCNTAIERIQNMKVDNRK